MTKTLLTIAAASGLAALLGTGPGFAQSSATPSGGDQLKHAEGPDTGKARSTPNMTQVPGSSTTGNASGPAGRSGPPQGPASGTGTGTGTAGNRIVPSPSAQ